MKFNETMERTSRTSAKKTSLSSRRTKSSNLNSKDILLTGFDALFTDHVFRPTSEGAPAATSHGRTNRPFKDLKEAGLIIDYMVS